MDMIKQYMGLCWFHVSPFELHSSFRFFKQNLIYSLVIFFFIQFNMTDDIESITEVIFETLLNLGFIALVLWLNNSMPVYIQVGTAILFSENIIATLLIPVIFWTTVTEDWLSYSVLGIGMLWNWIMVGVIFKHVLSINSLAGLVMSLFYFLFSFGGGFAINSLLTG